MGKFPENFSGFLVISCVVGGGFDDSREVWFGWGGQIRVASRLEGKRGLPYQIPKRFDYFVWFLYNSVS